MGLDRPQVNRQYDYYLLVGYFGQPGIGGEITRELVARIRPLLADIFQPRGGGGGGGGGGENASVVVGLTKMSEE